MADIGPERHIVGYKILEPASVIERQFVAVAHSFRVIMREADAGGHKRRQAASRQKIVDAVDAVAEHIHVRIAGHVFDFRLYVMKVTFDPQIFRKVVSASQTPDRRVF